MRAVTISFGDELGSWVLGIMIAVLAATSLVFWLDSDADPIRLASRASLNSSPAPESSLATPVRGADIPVVPTAEASPFLSPEVINSHVIFSRRCASIIYSSNRTGLLRPFVIDMTNTAHPGVSLVRINDPLDFVAQSLAPDCRTLAMVSDLNGNGSFAVYLYDLRLGTLQRITRIPGLDEGKPVFAPIGRTLAYLSAGNLSLYDYGKLAHLDEPSRFKSFTSITWSDNGASLFLEDEATNIWQYDLRTRKFKEIWGAPRIEDSPRTISQRQSHLLFTSDHESEYSQIYQLDLERGLLKRLYSSANDQHSPLELSAGRYTFRMPSH